jgi:ribulose kinase
MNAFFTGSRVYGEPRKDSDVDLVARVTPEVRCVLEKLSDTPEKIKGITVIRFGRLNIIACDDDRQFAAWKFGTEDLQTQKLWDGPVAKEEAKKTFDKIRFALGISDEYEGEQA